MNEILNSIWRWMVTEGVKVVLGLVLLYVLFMVINIITKKLERSLAKKKIDKTITITAISVIRKALKVLLCICFLTFLGVETSSISATIASISLAIGLSIQGSLSNLAGGIILLTLRPFKIGDYIECNDGAGTVEKIELFFTYLVTPDNKVLMVPNSTLANGKIINYNGKKTRRLEIIFSIDYGADFKKAKLIILNCIKESNLYLVDPAPFVNIKQHGTSSIDLTARVWVRSSDYWDCYWYLQEAVKEALDINGISIPFPQLDVHIKNDSEPVNYRVPSYTIETNSGNKMEIENGSKIQFDSLAPTMSQLERYDADEEAFKNLLKGHLFRNASGRKKKAKSSGKSSKKEGEKEESKAQSGGGAKHKKKVKPPKHIHLDKALVTPAYSDKKTEDILKEIEQENQVNQFNEIANNHPKSVEEIENENNKKK